MQRYKGRHSTIITALSCLITHHCSLITIWCISVANIAINHIDYTLIRAIPEIYRMIKPGKTIKMQIAVDSYQDRVYSCSKKSGTTLKLHHYYTEIDLEWVRNSTWNASGTLGTV